MLSDRLKTLGDYNWLHFLDFWDNRCYHCLFDYLLSFLNFLLDLFCVLFVVDLIEFTLANLLDHLELVDGHIISKIFNQVDIILKEIVHVLWDYLTFNSVKIKGIILITQLLTK